MEELNKLNRYIKHTDDPTTITGDILAIEDKIDTIEANIDEVKKMPGEKGEKGDKGDKGDNGRDGIDGKNGLNGKDGKDGVDGRDGVDGKDGKDGIDGVDGKDGSPDTPDQVIEKIHTSKKLIKREKIDGLLEYLRELELNFQRSLIGVGGGGASGIRDIRAGLNMAVSKLNEIYTVSTLSDVAFDTVLLNNDYSPTGLETPGTMFWNEVDGTVDIRLKNNATLQTGQELHFYGKASGNILNGELCQFAGSQGDHILIKKAVASEIIANPRYIVGVATQNITNGTFGYVTWFGKVNGVYTKTPSNNDNADWNAGDILYFNNSTGQLTKTAPTAPQRYIQVAAVVKAQTGSAENGVLVVRPSFGTRMTDLEDVDGTPLTKSGQLPVWDNTNSYFDFNYNYFTKPYREATSSTTLTGADYTLNCTSGSFNVTLPTAVGESGRIYEIKNMGNGVITLLTTSSQTIDGVPSGVIKLVYRDNFTLQSTGSNWIIL